MSFIERRRIQLEDLDTSVISGITGTGVKAIDLYSTAVSPPMGTNGVFGEAFSATPNMGYSRILPLSIKIRVVLIDITGSIAPGETITVRITFVYSVEGWATYIDKTFTALGEYYLSEEELFYKLWLNGAGIVRIDVQAASSAPSTSVGVVVDIVGVQY